MHPGQPAAISQERPRMKAEERKELEVNALRLRLRRWKEHFQGRALYTFGGLFLVVVAVVVIISLYNSSREARNSARNLELMAADTVKKLDEIITSDVH